jgi:hypothetical protein
LSFMPISSLQIIPIYLTLAGVIFIIMSRNIKNDRSTAGHFGIQNANKLLATIMIITGILSILAALFITILNFLIS